VLVSEVKLSLVVHQHEPHRDASGPKVLEKSWGEHDEWRRASENITQENLDPMREASERAVVDLMERDLHKCY
jgi:hypothetical protein